MDKFGVARRGALFFMHIPKTAGTSMRGYLQEQYYRDDIYPAANWREAVPLGAEVGGYSLVQGHFNYNFRSLVAPTAKALTILREPLARTVSSLRHLERDPAFHPDHPLARGKTLAEMLRIPKLVADQTNVQTAALCASAPPEEVMAYLRRALPINPNAAAADLEDPPNLALALKRLEQIEFLGTVERLGALLPDLSLAMRYHPAVRLSHRNDAPGPATTLAGLGQDEIDILTACNQLDLIVYRRAQDILVQRQFERAMLALIDNGTYRCMEGSFEIDLRDPIPGTGWYEAEVSGFEAWRWTGTDRIFTLEVPLLPSRNYRVVLGLSRKPLMLRAAVNGVPMLATLRQQNSAWLASLEIESQLLAKSSGLCRIVFDSGDAKQNVLDCSGDIRRLGVAVSSICFEIS